MTDRILLHDGEPIVVSRGTGGVGEGPWSRLVAAAVAPDERASTAERARALARAGRVRSVTLASGRLEGVVNGAHGPEHAALEADIIPDDVWLGLRTASSGAPRLLEALAGERQSIHLAHLLTVDWQTPLIPRTGAIRHACTCGVLGRCEHTTALGYVLASLVDGDPGVLLRWRGGAPSAFEPDASRSGEPPAAPVDLASPDGRWRSGELPVIGLPRRLPTAAVLRRLGASEIAVDGRELVDVLLPAYAAFARDADS